MNEFTRQANERARILDELDALKGTGKRDEGAALLAAYLRTIGGADLIAKWEEIGDGNDTQRNEASFG